jgi:hypothetical protein
MKEQVLKLPVEKENEKKEYEAPQFFRHDPLKSVSTTIYYYTYG